MVYYITRRQEPGFAIVSRNENFLKKQYIPIPTELSDRFQDYNIRLALRNATGVYKGVTSAMVSVYLVPKNGAVSLDRVLVETLILTPQGGKDEQLKPLKEKFMKSLKGEQVTDAVRDNLKEVLEEKPFSVKEIFEDNWNSYLIANKVRDIELKDTKAIYLPKIINQIKIKDQNYLQEVYSNKHNLLYDKDELNQCKTCKRNSTIFNSHLYFCKNCGRILCSYHKRLDAIDRTSVCLRCAFKKKLLLQTKFFISKKNKNQYSKKYEEMNFLRKFYEDKIAFWGTVSLISLILIV